MSILKDPGFRKSLPVLVAISISAFMVNLDTSIVSIALPTLTRIMNSNSSQVSRIILFYLLAIVSSLLFFGRLGDRIGKKPVFLAGYIVFTSASVLCGISRGLNMLIATRFLQGVGGAMLFATMSAIVIQNIGTEYRGRAFSMVAVFSGVGVAVGAPLGGFIVGNFGWRWIFYINVIPGIIGYTLAWKKLCGDSKPSNVGEGFDIPGILTSSLALIALIIAMNNGSGIGWFSPLIMILIFSSIILSILFLLREKRAKFPLVSLGIFSNLKLTSGLLAKLSVIAILNGTFVLFPFFLEKVMSISTTNTGLLLGIFPIVVLFASPLSGSLTDRTGSGKICSFSMFLIVVAAVMFLAFRYSQALSLVIPAFIIFGFAVGLFFPANMKLVMNQAVDGKEGMFSALNSLAIFLGAALGVAFMETIFSIGFPAVHDFSSLQPEVVASGFGRAMISGIVLSGLSFGFAVWSMRKVRKLSAA